MTGKSTFRYFIRESGKWWKPGKVSIWKAVLELLLEKLSFLNICLGNSKVEEDVSSRYRGAVFITVWMIDRLL